MEMQSQSGDGIEKYPRIAFYLGIVELRQLLKEQKKMFRLFKCVYMLLVGIIKKSLTRMEVLDIVLLICIKNAEQKAWKNYL